MTEKAVLLFLILNLCHWAADFTHLSTKQMLEAKRLGTPLPPILLHAYVHAFLMAIVVMIFSGFTSNLWGKMFVLQFISHTIIDVWKGKMNFWFPSLQNPANKLHWYVFGADQFFHQAVIIFMVYFILL